MFELHNLHLESVKAFRELDPQLRVLSKQRLVYRYPVLDELPKDIPGIYAVTGGRQIGKSTLLKQWMLELMNSGVDPRAIYYLTGEFIDDHHRLLRLTQQVLATMPTNSLRYLIIDEITYISGWDKCIKFLADAGLFQDVVVVLTGSDTVLLKSAIKRFPGRRGKAAKVNFHIYPLSFRKVVALKNTITLPDEMNIDATNFSEEEVNLLYAEFNNYLMHGGFLTAINDFITHKTVLDATLATYSDWIRGDVLRAGKQERFLQEILEGIIKRYTTQITWHSLAKDLSIDHHQTVSDYVELLSSMDAAFIQRALIEDKLTAAPKKARKVLFSDPFIYHACKAWIKSATNIYETQIVPTLQDKQKAAALAEACVTTHIRCLYPTYYIKAQAEVDIAYVKNKKFWPIEVKWTTQIRPQDLKQIIKYENGVVYTKVKHGRDILGVKTLPLPVALLQFDY